MATVDTSIYARNPLRTVTDYENELRQAELQKQGLAQNKLALETGRLKMDEYQRGVQRQNALQGILGGLGSDPEANTRALLKGGFMKEATDYQKAQVDAAKERATTIKTMAETLDKKIAQHTSLLSQVQNPQMAVQWMQAAYQDPDLGKIMSRLGPPEEAAKSIPQDPQGFQNWLLQASAGADKLRAQLAEEARDAETRANNLRTDTRVKSEGAANRSVQMRGQDLANDRAKESSAIAAQGNTIKSETDLRKEFADLPEVKNYKQAAPAFRAIKDAASRNTPASDINIVYGIAKIYDPTSVVREGEYATVANSPNIPERVKGLAQYLAGGGKLTADVKAQLLREAEGRLGSYRGEYENAKKTYEGIAQKRGVDTSQIFTNIGPAEETEKPTVMPSASDIDAELARRAKGR